MNQEIIYKIKYSSCHVKKFLLDILKKKATSNHDTIHLIYL